MTLRFAEDEVVQEQQDYGFAVLVVTLSDGRVVYQDDWVGAVEPTWVRLTRYLRQERLGIRRLRVKFRNEWLCPLPDDADAYYFARGVARDMSGGLEHFLVLGAGSPCCRVCRVDSPALLVRWWETRSVCADEVRLYRNP